MGNGLWYCLDDDVMPSWGYPLEAIEFFPNDEIQINCLHFVDKPKRSLLQEERKII
jgi:hypothetical protein